MKKLLAQIKLINSGKVVANNKSSILFRASSYQGVVTPLIGYISVYQDPDTKKYTIDGPVYLKNLDSIPASITGNWAAFDEFVNSNGDYPVYTVREVVTLENGKRAFLYKGYQFQDLTNFGDKLSIGQMTSGFTTLSWDVDLKETYFQLNGKAVKGTNATQITDDFPDIPIDAYVWDNGVYSNDCYEFTDLNSSSSIAALLPFDYDPNKAYLFKAKLKSNSFDSPGNGLCFITFDCFAMPAGGEGMPYIDMKQYDVRFTEDRRISVENQYVNLTSEKTLELNTWYWFFISFNENNSCCYLYVKEASETDQIENVTFESTDLVFVLDGVAEPAGDYEDINSGCTISEVLSRGYTVQLKNTALSTSLNPYQFCFPSGSGDPVKAKLTRSDLTPPNKYYISIGSTPATASITITNTVDPSKTTTATGQASLFLNDGESATVNVSLDGYTTVEKTITINGANHKEMITLEDNVVTFTITPTPSDATVKINNVVQNSVEVEKGSTVIWSVEKTGYVTQSGEEVVNEDMTKTITLLEETEPYTMKAYGWTPTCYTSTPTPTTADSYWSPMGSCEYFQRENGVSLEDAVIDLESDPPTIKVTSGRYTYTHKRDTSLDGRTYRLFYRFQKTGDKNDCFYIKKTSEAFPPDNSSNLYSFDNLTGLQKTSRTLADFTYSAPTFTDSEGNAYMSVRRDWFNVETVEEEIPPAPVERTEPTTPTDTFYAWINPDTPTGTALYTLTETPGSNDWIYIANAGDTHSLPASSSGVANQTLEQIGGTIDGTTLTVPSYMNSFERNSSYDGEFYLCKMWMNESNYQAYLTKNETPVSGDVVYHWNSTTGAVTNSGTVGTEWTYDSSNGKLTGSDGTLTPMTYQWMQTSVIENAPATSVVQPNFNNQNLYFWGDSGTPASTATSVYTFTETPTNLDYVVIDPSSTLSTDPLYTDAGGFMGTIGENMLNATSTSIDIPQIQASLTRDSSRDRLNNRFDTELSAWIVNN